MFQLRVTTDKVFLIPAMLFMLWPYLASSQPAAFLENTGQWQAPVRYRASLPGGFMMLGHNFLHYGYYSQQDLVLLHAGSTAAASRVSAHLAQPASRNIRSHGVRVNFAGANPRPLMRTEDTRQAKYLFFTGRTVAKTARAHQKIVYENIYPLTDLHVFISGSKVKYEFHLQPGADPSRIKMHYQGQQNLQIDNGKLLVATSVNQMHEKQPVCWQPTGPGAQQTIPSAFRLQNDTVSFALPEGYDPALPLVIDPELVFSSFSGSVSDNWGFTATYDGSGRLYSGGIVFGRNFPATTGAFQVNFDSAIDATVQRYNPDGSQLEYATFLGGRYADVPHSLVVNSKGEIVVMGTTSSADFPVTSAAFDRTFNGGTSNLLPIGGINFLNGSDIFVSVINEEGGQLTGSTFLGGSGDDGINELLRDWLTRNYGDEFRGEVEVDAQDNIYIASCSFSDDFPVTGNPFQLQKNDELDAIISKLSPDASTLLASTFAGGSGFDAAYSIDVSLEGQVAVAGGTSSDVFPAINGTEGRAFSGGSSDGWISIFDPGLQSVLQGRYLGTPNDDQVYFLDRNPQGQLAVLGQTNGQWPLTSGVYGTPNSGVFIQQFGENLSATTYSTVVGTGINQPDFTPTAFMVNDCGLIYLTGWASIFISGSNNGYYFTSLQGMPVTSNAFQSTTDGNDFYMMVLTENARELAYATFFGGPTGRGEHVDGGTSRFDPDGTVYQSVCSCEDSGYPVTPGAYDQENNSTGENSDATRCNNAVFKFALSELDASYSFEQNQGCAPIEVTFNNTSQGGLNFEWILEGEGTVSQNPEEFTYTFQEAGEYVVTLRAFDPASCQGVSEYRDTLQLFPGGFEVSEPQSFCRGDTVQLFASGGTSYNWRPAQFVSDPLSATPLAFPPANTIFTVEITNDDGCTATREVRVSVGQPVVANFEVEILDSCEPVQQARIINRSQSGTDFTWHLGDGRTVQGSEPGTITYQTGGNYQVSLLASNGACLDSVIKTIELQEVPSALFYENISLVPATQICAGDTAQLFATGGTRYEWSPAAGLSDPFIANPVASPENTTTYSVRIFNENDCFADTTVQVTVAETVNADFEVEYSQECNELPLVQFRNLSAGAGTFVWDLGNGQQLAGETPEAYQYTAPGVYQVTLLAGNNACVETVQREVLVERVVPGNVVTPNGDGANDFFMINSQRTGWQLEVFTRWGDRVYQSNDYRSDWSPEDLSNTSYFYILTSPEGLICRGWVLVMSN